MSGPVLLLEFFALRKSSLGMAETGERAITQYGGSSHPLHLLCLRSLVSGMKQVAHILKARISALSAFCNID
ncbi:hypothetical protein B0H14DRAFT_3073013, partial [Mycena olivaceomarginata]